MREEKQNDTTTTPTTATEHYSTAVVFNLGVATPWGVAEVLLGVLKSFSETTDSNEQVRIEIFQIGHS